MRKRLPRLSAEQVGNLERIAHHAEAGDEARRAQAIVLLEKDLDEETIRTATGYHLKHVFRLRKLFCEKGEAALSDKRKGRPKELLVKKIREEIIRTLNAKTPQEADRRYETEHWTTSILGDYIFRKYDVRYKSKTSYYLIFKQAKFTCHKPGRVYHERDEKEVAQWKNETKPKIERAWQEKNTVILAGDEMILGTQTTTQKVWLKQGEYPQIEVSNKRQNRSVYGFLNVKTGEEHARKTEKQNMAITKTILQKIRRVYPNQKLLLLWDSAGWHKGGAVQEFIAEDKRIEIIHFPRYDPEDNPQEHVWKKGRAEITHNRFIEDIDKATDEFVAYLNKTRFPYSLLGHGSVS